MIKHHYVVSRKPDGDIDLHPMKNWLRANPQYVPAGTSPDTSTSYQLRRAMRKEGWKLDEQTDRVLLIRPEDKDGSFVDALMHEGEDEDELIEAEEITFGLERDLQSALRANIDQLEFGLKVVDGGKERITEAGRIDITAEDNKGTVVVIELKAGTAAPESVTQILAYMGAVAATTKQPVRGILVAGEFHKKVILASHAIPNLNLKKYSFQFKFNTAI